MPKDDIRIECCGVLDEASAIIGASYSLQTNEEIRSMLDEIQKHISLVSAELASDEKGFSYLKNLINDEHVSFVEEKIDKISLILGKQTTFIVPGKTTGSSFLHLARAVVRGAERKMISLKRKKEIRPELIQYINRLSDFLFVLARLESEQLQE